MKNYTLKKIGDEWKSKRNTLFNNRNKLGDKTEEEVAAQIPPGVIYIFNNRNIYSIVQINSLSKSIDLLIQKRFLYIKI